jgi:hypothetical protein
MCFDSPYGFSYYLHELSDEEKYLAPTEPVESSLKIEVMDHATR